MNMLMKSEFPQNRKNAIVTLVCKKPHKMMNLITDLYAFCQPFLRCT